MSGFLLNGQRAHHAEIRIQPLEDRNQMRANAKPLNFPFLSIDKFR